MLIHRYGMNNGLVAKYWWRHKYCIWNAIYYLYRIHYLDRSPFPCSPSFYLRSRSLPWECVYTDSYHIRSSLLILPDRRRYVLSLRSQRDTMDFNPSRTAVRVMVSLRPPVSFLPIGTREERGGEGEGKRNSRVEKSWRGRSVDAQGNAIICNPA